MKTLNAETRTGSASDVATLQEKARSLEEEIADRKRVEKELQEAKKELEHQVQDLRQLHELSSRVSTTPDLDSILREVLQGALTVHKTDLGLVSLWDTKRGGLAVRVSEGFSEDFLKQIAFMPAGEGACGLSYQRRERVVIQDTETDPRFAPCREAARSERFRAVHSAPLITRGGNLIGILSVHFREPHLPSDREIRLLDLYARHGADAIESAQLRARVDLAIIESNRAEQLGQQLAAIVESSDDAIISKNLNGIIMTWNQGAERIFGYTAEEIIGKSVTTLIPADRQSEEAEILGRLRRGRRIDHYETVRRRKDGTWFDVSLTVSPIKNSKGEIVGASKIARDISERIHVERALKEARNQLARTNVELEQRIEQRTASLREAIAQMEEFSYSVSHDLRAPVRAMHGYARVLMEDYGNRLDEQGKEYLDRIIRGGTRMDRLIQDILTYSRLSRREIQLQPVSLDKLVREIVQQYPEIEASRAEILIPHPLAIVIAHEPSLTQAISNLINNAIKFIAPGTVPRVRVRTEPRDDQVRLWVEDNGIGIKPEHQHRLFGMFERIHPEKRYEGTGIGLAIVRKAVERMGGTVGVESDGLTGSNFWIQLPTTEIS